MGKGRDKRRHNAKRRQAGQAAGTAPLGDQSPDPADPFAAILAPYRPKPSPRSGAIALTEPEDPEGCFVEAPLNVLLRSRS